MCHSNVMQLDHVSYAVLAPQFADTVQRLGQELGGSFIDGGKHPRFGTRNFILPMTDGTYVEIVTPLDHPAGESAPFGRAVRERASAGGGWMGWVVRVDDIAPLESRLGRQSVPGHRVRPDGVDVTWRQIGVNDLIADPQLPYFIEWDDMATHPSTCGSTTVAIESIAVCGDRARVDQWLGTSGSTVVGAVGLTWASPSECDPGVASVTFRTAQGSVTVE